MRLIILILISIFLTLFTFQDTGLTITYSDTTLILIFPLFIYDFFRNRLIFNEFGNNLFYYYMFLLTAGLINLTYFDGPFLNIFKTGFVSWVIYIWVYSLVYRGRINFKILIFFVFILSVIFLNKTWNEIQESWTSVDRGFTAFVAFKSSLNLNSWGFILLLFSVFFIYAWSFGFYKKWIAAFLFFLVGFVLFSFSRASWGLLVLTLIWVFFYVKKFSPFALIGFVIMGILGYFVNTQFGFFKFSVSDAGINFFEQKSSVAGDDLLYIRFYLINIKPILEKYQEFHFYQFIFGDGISVQHSWVSNSLVVTGFVGFFLYVRLYVLSIKGILKNIKQKIITSKFVLLLLIIILVNDFLTNLSLFMPFIGYLTGFILGVFYAESDRAANQLINENCEKYNNTY